MKLHHASILLSSTLSLVTANAALIAYDGFGNGPRADLQGSTGGSGWNGAWTNIGSLQFTSVGGAGLTYANLLVTPGAAVTPAASGAFDAANYARSFTPIAPRMYTSFLLRFNGWGGLGANSGISFGGPYNLIGVPLTMNTYGIRLGHYLFVDTGIAAVPNQTALIVVELELVGTSTVYRMYVNPPLGTGQPATPNAQYTIAGATLPQSLSLVNAGDVTTDEIRIGTTWEDVTPSTFGACCINNSLCLMLTQADCAQIANAHWRGAGTTCQNGCATTCDSIDFNNDTSLFDPQDIDAFLSVYSEGPCVPASANCNDIDFNNDTSVFDPCDINSFLVMYSEGPCTPCGV